MLKRKIEQDIHKWIQDGKHALLIDGARQVGKTYAIRKVLNEENCDFVEFNLIKNPIIVDILSNTSTIKDLFTQLSAFFNFKLTPGKTIIFFDEIQEYKEIATMIKFLVDETDYKYILSGSLLGVELRHIKSAPVGYLSTLNMYPLDFEEFLQIYNISDAVIEMLHNSYTKEVPVPPALHERMLFIFKQYLLIGGMPEAVQTFKDTNNVNDVVNVHTHIVSEYKRDFTKYEKDDKIIYLNRIYDIIPQELNCQTKRFQYSEIQKDLDFTKTSEDFLWLSHAGVALPTYNVQEPVHPLILNEKRNLFKLFMSDVGLLTTLFGKPTKAKLLRNDPNINFGALYENVVAQELKAHDFDLYYYSSKKFGELDFVVEYNDEILPIEVKSGKQYKRHSAISTVINVENFKINNAIVFSEFNVERDDKILYLPIYMVMFLKNNDIELPLLEIPDLSNWPIES